MIITHSIVWNVHIHTHMHKYSEWNLFCKINCLIFYHNQSTIPTTTHPPNTCILIFHHLFFSFLALIQHLDNPSYSSSPISSSWNRKSKWYVWCDLFIYLLIGWFSLSNYNAICLFDILSLISVYFHSQPLLNPLMWWLDFSIVMN